MGDLVAIKLAKATNFEVIQLLFELFRLTLTLTEKNRQSHSALSKHVTYKVNVLSLVDNKSKIHTKVSQTACTTC